MITLEQEPSCNENEVFDGLDRNPAEIDRWESRKLALRDCVALLSGHLKAAVDSVYFGGNPLNQSAGILNFSPYAMSNALLMAAEGARGQTAPEMGAVLGIPESLRRKGDGSKIIPWEMGKIRVGQSELNRLMNKGDAITPEQTKLREEESTLAATLAEMEKKLEELNRERRQQGKNDGPIDLDYEKDDVAGKLEAVRLRIDTTKLRVANASWGEQTFPFHEDWKATVTGSYGVGAVQLADFVANAEKERLRINKWAEEQTEGLIKAPFPAGDRTQ